MKRFLIASVAAILLTSCGGGGSSKSSTPTNTFTQPAQPTITIVTSGLHVGVVNQPYSDSIGATVSNGAGSVTVTAQGTLPPGLSVSSSGGISGTPTQTGVFPLTFTATSATNSSVTASKALTLQIVAAGTVRNDALASATALACCGTIRASFSPYAKASGVAAADQDLYKITATAGDRISVDAVAIGTAIDTDTFMQILDASGALMATCKTPQANASFNQVCVNDDVNPGVVRGSHLDVQLPQSSGVFVVRVLDLYGRARPEMTYELRTVKLP